jgi:ATP/maltotriose-dependent transcriptional regulator MalT/DNA-binding SARP family transcriptional activator
MPPMPSRGSAPAADLRRDTSVPSAPADRLPGGDERELGGPERPAEPAPVARTPRKRPRLVVDGVRPEPHAGLTTPPASLGPLPEFPIQISKVQAPPLREETLARDRLLEWLSIKIHRRVVLLVAEAGYGKTTLLADFTRRTRVRILWYRLDRGDRDWVGFLAYLVASIRVHVPDFGAATTSLLRETATSAPSLETVLDTFLRELGGVPGEASALVFDDFHLVDDSPEVRHIIRELLARGPDRMSFVFATRREPPIRLARLRAQGEVAELHTDDLRFDATETEQLFRDTYDLRIEPAMLAELSRRTEGWAASLQLVRAALNDRDPSQVRAFISSLSGAEGHLYDYLAEEVIGDLPADLQQFLMRTSLLETVDLVLGPVAAGVSVDETRAFIEQGERHGLLGGGSRDRHAIRVHPLVRDFLASRLTAFGGAAGVEAIHSRIALAAESFDWNIAARHYIAADRCQEAERVLAQSIDAVLATGAYESAQDIADQLGETGLPGTPGLILRSRLAQQRAAVQEALALAEMAWASDPASSAALVNLVTARSLAGDLNGALEAGRLLEESAAIEMAWIARAYQRTIESSVAGSLELAHQENAALAVNLRGNNSFHYLGVALLNMACIQLVIGHLEDSLASAEESIGLLQRSGAVNELVAARLARSMSLGALGKLDQAREEGRLALEAAPPGQLMEVVGDLAEMEAFYGHSRRAWELFERIPDRIDPSDDTGAQITLARAMVCVRDGDHARANREWQLIVPSEPHTAPGFEAIRQFIGCYISVISDDESAVNAIAAALEHAAAQGATLWVRVGQTLQALANRTEDPSPVVTRIGQDVPVALSIVAEAVIPRLPELDSTARATVFAEASRRPARWQESTRKAVRRWDPNTTSATAELLESIGEPEDIPLLAEIDKRRKGRNQRLGYQLARRLAPRVLVEDLGRVRVMVGDRSVEGSDVRRKVLALLCLLLSRQRFAATRDEAIDSLWPENDPASALNSLNQTVYFLRRIFEPRFVDGTSPGYIGQDSETIWLDAELVESRSRRCVEVIRTMAGEPTPEGAFALANEYRGQFALDFAYEDWSVPFRDALHASYLRVMERAIRMDLDSGHFARGTYLAERATEVDPDAEEIQVALVRLYRHQGAHAAAAEQYAHYAQTMRAMGEEPRPISDL